MSESPSTRKSRRLVELARSEPVSRDRSLLSSPNRRNSLARRPLREIVGQTTPATAAPTSRSSGSKKTPNSGSRQGKAISQKVVDYSMTETSSSEEDTEEQRDQVDDISRVPSPSDGKARRADKKFAAATSPPNTDYKTSSPYVEADAANAGNPSGVVPPSRKFSTRGNKTPQTNQSSSSFRSNKSSQSSSTLHNSPDSPTKSFRSRLNFSDAVKDDSHDAGGSAWFDSCINMLVVVFIAFAACVAYSNQAMIHSKMKDLGLTGHQREAFTGLSDPRTSVTEAVNNLKAVFPSQSQETWRQIKSSLIRVNSPNSDQAFCYLVIGGTQDDRTDCFASAVAETAAGLRNKTFSPGVGGGEVGHESIKTKLQTQGSVSLPSLDAVGGEKAMALHGFCDSATLPLSHAYVHSTIVSTLRRNPGSFHGSPEEYGSQELTSVWSQSITKDKVSSLVSRVVLSATYFKQETKTVKLDEFCSRFQ